jgi:colanic acid/amylovoran biosynthesis glycosyltransferase
VRIAFLVNRFPSISETFVLNQVTGLLDLGQEVTIFTLEAGKETVVHPDVDRYQLVYRTRRLYWPNSPASALVRLPGWLVAGLMHPRMAGRMLRSSGFAPWAIPAAIGFARSGPFDVLHCQFGTLGRLGALLKEVGLVNTLVTSFHGYDLRLGLEKGRAFYRALVRAGDVLLVHSQWAKDILLELGFDGNRVVLHRVGIDLGRFARIRSDHRSRLGDDTIEILTVARLVPEKGLDLGLRALADLVARSPDYAVRYTILGDGPLAATLRSLVAELGLQEVVRLAGAADQRRVTEALSQADLFFLPSRSEGLPVVSLEAQAMAVPVVATRVGGVHEGVLDGRSGVLVPTGNVRAMADALERLGRDPALRNAMGRAGREAVLSEFDIKRLNRRLVTIYEYLAVGESPECFTPSFDNHPRNLPRALSQ